MHLGQFPPARGRAPRSARKPVTRPVLIAALLVGLGAASACGAQQEPDTGAEAEGTVEDDVVHSSALDAQGAEMLESAVPTAFGDPALVAPGTWTVLDVDLDARERLAELKGREPRTAGQIVLVSVRLENTGDVPISTDAHITLVGGDDRVYFDLCRLPTDLGLYAGEVVDPGHTLDAFICRVLEPEAVEGARLLLTVPYEDEARPAVWSLDGS